MSIWHNLVNDPQVHIQNPDDENFRRFVQSTLPEIIGLTLDKPVSASSLMEAQHLTMCALEDVDGQAQSKYSRVTEALSVWPQAEHALELQGSSSDDFYRIVPGFSHEEIQAIKEGRMKIRDVLYNRPAVILRPLLKSRQQ